MKLDIYLILPVVLLLIFSYFILNSISPALFPSYFWYFGLGIIAFLFFSLFDFEVFSAFSKYLYIISILLLVVTLIIGQATRGTVRWIPIGGLSFQPSEIVRPFLLVFFANYLTYKKLDLKRIIHTLILMGIPLFLILVQPSLGVTALTAVGFLGLFLAADLNKKNFLYLGLIVVALIPLIYFSLAPYQKTRITSFLDPASDPLGVGYNAIQSTISVGSGMFFGRGLGKGVNTQLLFLPERHTDFIFASISEEMGFIGAFILLALTAVLFFRIVKYLDNPLNIPARIFLSGVFLTLFAQVFVHTGMNMGLLPITGVPYPLVSAGGSSLLATMITLGIVVGTKKL
ncbi:MAG: FtsW/RodA/SpoVE family cell cycle protein [bacterium]|nr:MAG: FtsW/RodA/SpoVE family cell cycle protein [bacterium]